MKTKQTAAERALAISTEAAQVGFDWARAADVIPKPHEEIDEIANALAINDRDNLVEEVGDLFFALINFNRKAKIDSDAAFHYGVDKFERRYRRLEQLVEKQNRDIKTLSSDELEDFWRLVKLEESNAR